MNEEARCYTVPEVLEKLKMAKSTFTRLKREGKLPCLEEIRPRLGQRVRYRADLIDRYLRNEWNREAAATPGRRRFPKAV
jgi:predicted DNA-binding transcriptional regulator AlpA